MQRTDVASDQQPGRILESVELIGKAFILLTGICYALGLTVVSIHLHRYGIYSLGLLELNYVIAGLWTLCPILLAVFGAAMGITLYYQNLTKEKQELTRLRKLASVAVAVGACPVGVYGFLWPLKSSLGFDLGSWLWVSLLGMIVGLSIFGFITWVRQPLRAGPQPELAELALRIGGLFGILVVLALYTIVFANGAYKEIPAELGGGRTGQVSFIVDSASKPYLQAAGLRFRGDSNRSEPVDLVLATDREYTVLLKSTGPATSIPNTVVKAVLHEGR